MVGFVFRTLVLQEWPGPRSLNPSPESFKLPRPPCESILFTFVHIRSNWSDKCYAEVLRLQVEPHDGDYYCPDARFHGTHAKLTYPDYCLPSCVSFVFVSL